MPVVADFLPSAAAALVPFKQSLQKHVWLFPPCSCYLFCYLNVTTHPSEQGQGIPAKRAESAFGAFRDILLKVIFIFFFYRIVNPYRLIQTTIIRLLGSNTWRGALTVGSRRGRASLFQKSAL